MLIVTAGQPCRDADDITAHSTPVLAMKGAWMEGITSESVQNTL